MPRGKILTALVVLGVLLLLFALFRSCNTGNELPPDGPNSGLLPPPVSDEQAA